MIKCNPRNLLVKVFAKSILAGGHDLFLNPDPTDQASAEDLPEGVSIKPMESYD